MDDNKGSSSGTGPTTDEEVPISDVTGYIHNVRDVTDSSFSFDLQTSSSSSKRFLCYSPHKRRRVDENLKSPVKLKNIKAKGQKNYYNEKSVMEPATLDFQPVDYANLTINKLNQVPHLSLIDLTVKVLEKTHSKKVEGKNVDTYVAGDNHGMIKLTLWGEDKLCIGSVYDLKNIRVNRDTFDIPSLATPREGFSISKNDNIKIETGSLSNYVSKDGNEIKGEIMSMESFVKYRTCDKCNKKLPSTTASNVKCAADGCTNSVKLKFAGKACYVRFNFMTEEGQKLHLTMFTDEVAPLVPKFWEMSDKEFREEFLDLPELVIRKTPKDVVSSARLDK